MDITIRQFRLDDYDRAVALWQQAGLSVRPGDDRASIARLLERNPGLFFVAIAFYQSIGFEKHHIFMGKDLEPHHKA